MGRPTTRSVSAQNGRNNAPTSTVTRSSSIAAAGGNGGGGGEIEEYIKIEVDEVMGVETEVIEVIMDEIEEWTEDVFVDGPQIEIELVEILKAYIDT